MRARTAVGILLVLVALGAAAIVGLGLVDGPGSSLSLSSKWVSDTGRDVNANHHSVAVGEVDGEAMVFAPVSGRSDTADCGLYAFYANGTRAWEYPVPPGNCTIHAVADATTGDVDGDGRLEALTATTEQALHAFDAETGASRFRHELTSYGYSQPVVADLTGDGANEVIVVDAFGTVFVLEPDGTEIWSDRLDAYTWGQPSVADFDGDGDNELAVGVGGNGTLVLYEADGTEAWSRTSGIEGGITWLTTGQADDDPAIEIAVATPRGGVHLIDGADGTTQWQHDFDAFAAVHAFGDGDGDGDPDIYATARDGVLRAIHAESGDIKWTTTLTTDRVQMMPPPVFGDIDDDGARDLVVASNDGIVFVVDPASGDIRTQYERDAPIYTNPVTADIDGDGSDEIIVMYGDGRVVVLDATT